MSRPALRTVLAATFAASVLLVAGCATTAAPAPSGTETPAADEGYVTPGKLTVATGDIAYEPYVIDDDPTSGKGFESAVAYAVADKLGFSHDDVVWVRTSFESAIAPGPKNFDFNLQQYTITEEREQAVDFSSPYYSASQGVVAIEGGAADGVTDIAGLKKLQLGAMAGSTSATTIESAVAPDKPAQLYNSNEDAVAALTANQIDAIVLDLPTSYIAVNVYIENSFLVGELPTAGVADEWGLLLPNNSPLTERVTAAVDALRDEGTLEDLQNEWLSVLTAGAPLLK